MPDGGGLEWLAAEAIELADAAFVAVAPYATAIEVAAVAASAYMSYESGVRARNAYNNSLRDRYVMQRSATAQRALVLGRARVSGPVAFMQSYGSNQTTLAMVVVLAAHQCDAIEKIYFNDQEIVVDASGNVVGALNTEHFSVNSSAPLTVFLAQAAQATTIVATAQYADATINLSTSLASDGAHLTLTGARATGVADVKVTYQPQVCQYTPGQLLDQQTTQTATAATGSYTFPNVVGSQQNYPGYKYSYFTVGGTVASSVVVVQTINGTQTALSSTCAINSSGIATSVSWTGATAGAKITITYQAGIQASRARVRQYLGAPGQAADATLIANLPGEWTTAHVGNSMCYLVCEFDYDPSSFPAGLPNVSAVVRGAQLFDPRIGETLWTENPAILARGYWTHSLGANQPSTSVDDTAIMAAANVCDNATTYLVGPTLIPQPAPLYTAGYVATKDMKPQDVLTDLCNAMGGRWVIAGNKLRVKAGAYTAPVAAIDVSWLTSESSTSVTPLPPRQSLFNAAQGTFCDATNDYRAVLYPKQVATALVAADGRELDLDITYNAVTSTAQAQYLAACAIRYNRAGMSVKIACNLRAFPLEVFDVVTLTLPRFGFNAQTFEVTDTSFTPEGLVLLALKYINPAIWALDASYQLTAYAPKTVLPSPWDVGIPVLGAPQTGAAQLLKQADGTIVSRIYVPLSVIDVSVISSGFMDVSFIDAADTTGNWDTVTVSGDSQGAYLAPVQDGHTYLIKARARNTLFASSWSASIACLVLGLSAAPTAVSDLAYTTSGGYVVLTWAPNSDADYKETAVRFGPVGTTGNAWSGAGVVEAFRGAASTYAWPAPAAGNYEIQVEHFNTSGIGTSPAVIDVTAPNPAASFVVGNLSLYSAVVPSDAAGNVTNFSTAVTTLTILVSDVDDTANWTIAPSVTTGMTFSASGATFSITGLDAAHDSGVLTLTATKAALPTIVRNFAVTKAKAGATGAAGLQYATAYLWQWSTAQPGNPSSTSTYTWATGAQSNYMGANGWSVTVPANPGTPGIKLWVASIQVSAASTVTTSTVSWAAGFTVAAWSANGLGGPAGASGVQTAQAKVYQWAATIPAGPTGPATYTWASSTFGAAPSGWSLTAGTTPSPGFTLWAAAVTVTDVATNATTGFNWTSASITAAGYAGTNGGPGGTGAQGASATIAYTVVSIGTSPASTPNPDTVTGNSLPAANTWGMGETWTTTVPGYGAGQAIYQTNGVYNPTTGNTVWGLPYLSALKVGSLSAISANLGSITSGDIYGADIRGGNFTGWAWPTSGGGFYLGPNGLLLGNYNTGGYWQFGQDGSLYSPGMSMTSAGVLTVNAITIGGTGLIGGIGTGSGAAVANSLLTAPIAAAAQTAVWTSVSGAPLDTSNMVNTPSFQGATGVGPWSAGSVAAVTGEPFTAALSTTARDTIDYTNLTPVSVGETIFFAAWMNASAATQALNFGMVCWNAAGGYTGFIAGVSCAAGTPGWTYLVGSGVVPGGTAKIAPWIQLNGTSGACGTGEITLMYMGRAQPGANSTYVDGTGAIQGVSSGGGSAVANALLTAPIAAAATTAQWSGVSAIPGNISGAGANGGAVLNSGISVDGSGTLQGIGSGAGAAVANSLLTAPIAAAAQTAAWAGVSGIPAPLQSPGSAGLYLTNGALGYWNGSAWASYLDSNGDFYLGGPGGSLTYSPGGGLVINGSGTFSGTLNAANGHFSGTLSVGSASNAAVSATLASTTQISAGATGISSGVVVGATKTVGGGNLLLICNLNVFLGTNTNTPFDLVLNLYDGTSTSLFNVNTNPQPVIVGTMTNTHVGSSTYNWSVSENFDLSLLIPGGTLTAGSHAFYYSVQANFLTASGTPNTITGSQLICSGQMKVVEFVA